MSCKMTAYSALTALLLASSPCWAMSVVTVPTNGDGTPRFTNPNDKAQSQFKGSVQTTTTPSGNPFGFSGVTPGNGRFGFGDPTSNMAPGMSNPDLFRSAPTGSSLTDPTFGPNGVYTPGLRGNSARQ